MEDQRRIGPAIRGHSWFTNTKCRERLRAIELYRNGKPNNLIAVNDTLQMLDIIGDTIAEGKCNPEWLREFRIIEVGIAHCVESAIRVARPNRPAATGLLESREGKVVAVGNAADRDDETTGEAIIRPPENAFMAWRLRDLAGFNNQTELAEELSKKGIPATQGQVSRWLTQVTKYLAAGNVLPEITPLTSQPHSIDPRTIDMGARQDGRTARQRERRNPEGGR